MEAKPAERENFEEKTIEMEMQSVKILLETGEFDNESIRIDLSNVFSVKKENELHSKMKFHFPVLF